MMADDTVEHTLRHVGARVAEVDAVRSWTAASPSPRDRM
jgi:hypothetical protein